MVTHFHLMNSKFCLCNDFLNSLFSSLLYCNNAVYNTQKKYVLTVYVIHMLPVNRKLLVFWESKILCGFLTVQGLATLSPCIVRGSPSRYTVLLFKFILFLITVLLIIFSESIFDLWLNPWMQNLWLWRANCVLSLYMHMDLPIYINTHIPFPLGI